MKALSKEMKENVDAYAGGIRELLSNYKVPKSKWKLVWTESEDLPVFAEAELDLHLQWFLGWFRGVADLLGVEEKDLVKL